MTGCAARGKPIGGPTVARWRERSLGTIVPKGKLCPNRFRAKGGHP